MSRSDLRNERPVAIFRIGTGFLFLAATALVYLKGLATEDTEEYVQVCLDNFIAGITRRSLCVLCGKFLPDDSTDSIDPTLGC